MSVLQSLQDSPFTDWLLGSDSIWTYPLVLTLHTAGLAVLVGASVILHLRLLDVGRTIPLSRFRSLFPAIWAGFGVNLVTGLMLFVTQAADLVVDPIFGVKLGSIALALGADLVSRRWLNDSSRSEAGGMNRRWVAAGGLAMWTVAIVSGRLMAYFKG